VPQLSQLASGGVAVVTYGTSTVTFTYDEDQLTGKMEKKIRALQERLDAIDEDDPHTILAVKQELAGIICKLATGWDVTDDPAGNIPTPYDVAHVARTGLRFMYAALDKIAETIMAKNPVGMTSAGSAKRSGTTGSSSARARRTRNSSPR